MQFEDEMDYYGISLERKIINGEKVYIFSKYIDKDLVYEETKRFLEKHNVESLDIF